MKNKILTSLFGVSLLCGFSSHAMAQGKAGDLAKYDIDLDLTEAHVYKSSTSTRLQTCDFDNSANECTDTAGIISGSSFLYVTGISARTNPQIQIALKDPASSCKVLAGTYDVYLVMVPDYYRYPTDAPEYRIKNKISTTLYYHNSMSDQRPSTTQAATFEYSGERVDTVLLYEGLTLPTTYYGFNDFFPYLQVTSQRLSNTDLKNNYSYSFSIDRVILKARSIDSEPTTIYTGPCGENASYSLDITTGLLTISGTGALSAAPQLNNVLLSCVKDVLIKDGITEIGAHTFAYWGFRGLTLPKTLKAIGDYAFSECAALPSVTFPPSLTSIGESAFMKCKNIRAIELPEGLQTMGASAFAQCDSLTSVSLPSTLHAITEHAFSKAAIRTIDVPEGVQAIEQYAFYGCDSLVSVSLPSTLKSIGVCAFGYTNVNEITIPVNVQSLGGDLFAGAPLTSVYWNARTCNFNTDNDEHPFLSVKDRITSFHIGQEVQHIPDDLCWGMLEMRDFRMGENVVSIGSYALGNCGIRSINIPTKTTNIAETAFCSTTMTAINVAANNEKYCDEDGVLFNKSKTRLIYFPGLANECKRYEIPNNVTSLGECAFADYDPSSVSLPWTEAASIPAISELTFRKGITLYVPHVALNIYKSLAPYSNYTIVSDMNLQEYMESSNKFSVFNKLLVATGWADTLAAERDEEYERLYNKGAFSIYLSHPTYKPTYGWVCPSERKFGFTILAEADSVFEAMTGMKAKDITPGDVLSAINTLGMEGTADTDYASQDNQLNRFVSYHLLPVALKHDKLVRHSNEYGYDKQNPTPTITVTEYYETLGKGRRLLKMSESAQSGGVRINRYAKHDALTYQEMTEATDGFIPGIPVEDNSSRVVNGYVYAINEPLVYTGQTARKVLAGERMRHDMVSLFPELTNNDIRMESDCYLPPSSQYSYCDNMTANTHTYYMAGKNRQWGNHQEDEINFVGRQTDITIKLPSVPVDGMYELRIGTNRHWSNGSGAGIPQFFMGQDKAKLLPCGLPVKLTIPLNFLYTTTDFRDTGDAMRDRMVDLQLREMGVMKSPKSICTEGTQSIRDYPWKARTIIGRFSLKADETYYLRISNCEQKDQSVLGLDYLEWVPEGVYANPTEAEDLW